MSKPIFVPLSTEPFLAFERGEKTVEIRALGSPVAAQLLKDAEAGRPVRLRLGYSGRELPASLGRHILSAGSISLPEWAKQGACVDLTQENKFFDRRANLVAFEAHIQGVGRRDV